MTDDVMAKVLVYSKPNCQACKLTKDLLDDNNVAFREIDVIDNPQAADWLRAAGYRELPVVVVNSRRRGDPVWSGFRPEKIRGLYVKA